MVFIVGSCIIHSSLLLIMDYVTRTNSKPLINLYITLEVVILNRCELLLGHFGMFEMEEKVTTCELLS